jgi:hypothetical protein
MRTDQEEKFLSHLGLDPKIVVPGSVGVEFGNDGPVLTYSIRQGLDPQMIGIAMMVAAGMSIQNAEPETVEAEIVEEGVGGD